MPEHPRTIGFIVPDLSGPGRASVWLGMADAARQSNVNLVCFPGRELHSPNGYDSQSNLLYDLGRNGRADAIVLWGADIGRYVGDGELSEFAARYSKRPLVCVEKALPGVPSLIADLKAAFDALVGHLAETHGCRSIAFAGDGGGERYEAFAEALSRYGIHPEAPPAEWKNLKALEAWIHPVRKKGKRGIISGSRAMTARLYAAAADAGIRIPRDIAVCGLEDSPEEPGFLPPLALSLMPYRGIGRAAVKLALALLENKPVPQITRLKPKCLFRGACGCAEPAAGRTGARAGARNAARLPSPERGDRAEVMRRLETSLLGVFEAEALIEILAEELPRMGIREFYLSLYQEAGPYRYPQPAPEHSRLILSSAKKKEAAPGRRYATRRLLPDVLWSGERRFLLAVPLCFRKNPLGFMLLEAVPPAVDLADRLSAFVSSALHGAELSGLEEKRIRQLQAATAVSRASSSILDPRRLMGRVVELIRSRFRVSRVGLYTVDDTGKYAVLRAGTDVDGDSRGEEERRVPIGPATLVGACIADARVRISLDPGADAASLLSQDRTEMALPLVSRAELIGAISVRSDPGISFGDEEIKILQTMADQIANAVENARLFEEQKQAELELKRERNLLRTLIDHIPDYIYVKDTGSRFVTANVAVASIMGAQSPEELTGRTDFNFYERALAEKYRTDDRKVVEEGKILINQEEYAVDRAGRIHWNLTSKVPLRDEAGLITGLVGIGRDITEKKRAEEELRLQTGRLQIALEVARAVTSLLDVKKVLPRVAELIHDKFGYYCVTIFVAEGEGQVRLRAMAGDSVPIEYVGDYTLPMDGRGIIGRVYSTAEPYICQNVHGDSHYWPVAFLEKTASEACLPMMIGSTVLGCLDVQSTETDVFTPESVTILKTMAFQIAIAVQNGNLHAAEKERAHELEEAYRALKENTERGLVAEKMASLGRLTAGIAHEMNTLLAALRASLSEIQTLVKEYQAAIGDAEVTAEDHREIAAEMMKSIQLANTAAERTAGFVRGIKTQTRTIGAGERQLFNAVPVIEEALLLLSHALRKANCTASFKPAVDYAQLMGSPGRMAQIVTNLVVNAIDASAEKGGGQISIGMAARSGGIELAIADSGAGIDPAVLPKIFEPLFTTKPVGVGTGLGLTIVHDIVVGEFGGTVEVSSTPGKGTVFTLFFPAPE